MEDENIDIKKQKLTYSVCKRMLYHEKMWGWNLWVSRILNISVLVFSVLSVSFVIASSPSLAGYLGLSGCLLGLWGAVGDYSVRSYRHN